VATTTTTTETLTFEELAAAVTGEEINEDLVADEIKSQSDEVSVVSSAFAEQLSSVQSQLMALSHLPKTIQSTLDEITKQLQSLIPTITTKAREEKLNENENNPSDDVDEGDDDDEENVMTSEGCWLFCELFVKSFKAHLSTQSPQRQRSKWIALKFRAQSRAHLSQP
jgi:hypothetical protein